MGVSNKLPSWLLLPHIFLEAGTDLRHIREILEHNGSKTTQIMPTQVKRIREGLKARLDDLDIKL